MAVVRMADIAKTPDIRTRAILPEWCASFDLQYMSPMLSSKNVGTLLAAAGLLCGIGDGRQQKGKLNFGQYRLCEPDDPDFLRIQSEGGIAAQDAALNSPMPPFHDAETEQLFSWFVTEQEARGRHKDGDAATTAAPAKRGRKAKANGSEAVMADA